MEHLLVLTTLPNLFQNRSKSEKLDELITTLKDIAYLPTFEPHKVMQPLLTILEGLDKDKEAKLTLYKTTEKPSLLVDLDEIYRSKIHLPNHHHNFHFYDKDAEDEETVFEELEIVEDDDDPEIDKSKVVEKTEKKKAPVPVKKLDNTTAAMMLEFFCKELLGVTKGTYLSKRMEEYDEQASFIKEKSLFKLSVTNKDLLWAEFDKAVKEETVRVRVLEYVDMDATNLSKFFKIFPDISKMKNTTMISEVCCALKNALWNFIINYNDEYQKYQVDKNLKELSTVLTTLFDTFNKVYDKKKECRSYVSPLMAIVVTFIPTEIASLDKGTSVPGKWYKGIQKLIAAKSKDDQYLAASTALEWCRASSYAPKGQIDTLTKDFVAWMPKLITPDPKDFPKRPDGAIDFAIMMNMVVSEFISKRPLKELMLLTTNGVNEHRYVIFKGMLALNLNPDLLKTHPRLDTVLKDWAKLFQENFKDLAQQEPVEVNTPVVKTEEKKTAPKAGLGGLFGSKKEDVNTSVPAINYTEMVMKSLLYLFAACPTILLEKYSNTIQAVDGLLSLLTDSFVTNPNNKAYRQQIDRALRKIFLEKYIFKWFPSDLYGGFVNIMSSVSTKLSAALFDEEELHSATMKELLSLIRYMTFRTKIFFLNHRSNLPTEVQTHRKRLTAIELLASNLLVCLCSTDREVWVTTTKCLRDICDQIDILQNQDLKYLNYNFYSQLTNVEFKGDPSEFRNKQIQLFRRIEMQTKSNLRAFDGIYDRWKKLVAAPENKDVLEYLTKMLCALGGVCLMGAKDKKDDKKKGKPDTGDDRKKLDSFMNDLMTQMIADDLTIRGIVTKAIATDLAPALYDKLIRNMNANVKKNTKLDDKAKNFLLQTIVIVKSILDSKDATLDLALAVELEVLLSNMTSSISTYDGVDKDGIHVKNKYCQLLESVMAKADYITFRSQTLFRNEQVYKISDWASEYALKGKNADKEIQAKYDELNISIMKAVSALLDGHKLTMEQQDDFIKIYAFLKTYIEKCKKKGPLRNYTIRALGGLLRSNLTLGLQNYMQMVYSQDELTRSAFLSLLSSIVKQGFSLNSAQEEEKKVEAAKEEKQTNKYDEMVKQVFAYDQEIIFIIMKAAKNNEKDEFLDSIVKLTMQKPEGEKDLLRILEKSVKYEVASTLDPGTLFRANSTASKLMKNYSTRIAAPFLQKAIGNFVSGIAKNPKNFEIDPSKCKKDEDPMSNTKNVERLIEEWLEAFVQSTAYMPYTFRCYCKYLYDTVGERFQAQPDDALEPRHIAVGGFLFLRVVCPAIINPEPNGVKLTDPINNDGRRFVIIITKVLQNLANGIVVGNKEIFMDYYITMIKKWIPRIKKFFEELASEPEVVVPAVDENPPELTESLYSVHRFLYSYTEIVRGELEKLKEDDHNAYEKCSALMERLKKPPEKQKGGVGKKDDENSFTNDKYEEFMSKMSEKDSELVAIEKSGVFHVKGKSKLGYPTAYLTPRFYKKEQNDLLIYYILKNLEPLWTSPFTLVVDCTLYEPSSEIPLTSLLTLINIVPKGCQNNLKQVILFNPNAVFGISSSNKLFTTLPIIKTIKTWASAIGLEELSVSIDKNDIALCDDTQKILRDMEHAYPIKISPKDEDATIVFRDSYVSLITTENNAFFVKKVDFLKNLAKVRVESKNTTDFEVQLADNTTYHLSSVDSRDKIIQGLNKAISSSSRNTEIENLKKKVVKQISPADVPGQLLNIAFMNLESTEPESRLSAYNLLSYMATRFGLELTNIVESDQLSIPYNTTDLVCELSSIISELRPDLTLEFLNEALLGFSQTALPRAQLKCIRYMKFWVKNLKKYAETGEKEKKLNQFLTTLVDVSFKFKQTLPSLCEIWGMLAESEPLLKGALDTLIGATIDISQEKNQLEALADILISIATYNHKFVSSYLFDRIFELLKEFKILPNTTYAQYSKETAWRKLYFLIRHVMSLSFRNKINLEDNLPYIFYISGCLLGYGDLQFRSTLYATIQNCLHTLNIEGPPESKEDLGHLMVKIKESEYVSLFLGTTEFDVDPFRDTIEKDPVFEPTSMHDVQKLSEFFSQLFACFPDFAEFWTHSLSKICKVNLDDSILFPRILNVFSTVAVEIESYAMVSYTVRLLEKKGSAGIQNSDLCSSILLSTIQFLDKIQTHDTKLLDNLFIWALMLIPVATIQTYNACMDLLNTLVYIMTKLNLFDGYESIGDYFEKAFENQSEFKEFEKIIGITFAKHYSFALSVILLKGLVEVKTREQTLKLLRQLLKTQNKIGAHSRHSLGFITPLLPFEQRYQKTVYLEQFYQKEIFDHPERVFLFQKYLFTLGKELTIPEEIISVYTPLTEGFNLIPTTFEDVFKDHHAMTQTIRVYTHGQTEQVSDIGLLLFKSMTQVNHTLSTKEPFKEYGFEGFKKHINFTNPCKTECTTSAIKFMKSSFDNQQGVEILEEAKRELEREKAELAQKLEAEKLQQEGEKKDDTQKNQPTEQVEQ